VVITKDTEYSLLAFENEYPVQFHSSTANKTGNIVESNIILS
jgi:hypothetical protein